MAAFIPNRRDPAVTEAALAKVRDDKVREANDGFDGTWVAHPDLVETAMTEFDRVLGAKPNQLDRQRPEVTRQTKPRSEEHTSELQSLRQLLCRLLLGKQQQ